MKRLLMHTCCGPCLIFPYRELRDEYELTSYYFNPNIHPTAEYIKRAKTLAAFCGQVGIELVVGAYEPKEHLRQIADNIEGRCGICYTLRLRNAARYAAEHGYDAFTTTLLVSPYQDHELIQSVAEEAAALNNVTFFYRDFRGGFREGQNEARERGLYRQQYCGCIYSEFERNQRLLSNMNAAIESGQHES